MDYNLDSLGPRNFEHLAQSLLSDVIGPKLMVFGDGPDGGREAIWRGPAPSLGTATNWDGYGVVQAKFKLNPDTPASNLTWLKATIRNELVEWSRADSKRDEKPAYLLFVTNVRLSSVPGKGKDEVHEYVRKQLSTLKLAVSEVRIWDYYELIAQLDNNASVRKRYSAFVTPGDLVTALIEQAEGFDKTFGQAIASYTARSLRDEGLLNLTQAGTAGDGQVTIGDVFIDLPADLPGQPWLLSEHDASESEMAGDNDDEFGLAFELDISRAGIAQHLVNDFNHIPEARRENGPDPHRTVLVGGPGQGKSTVTQWLAQIYRIEFLRGSPILNSPEVSRISQSISSRREKLEFPEIQARRWPVRLVLTELADHLARSPEHSLLHYIAAKVSDRSSAEIDPIMLRKWLSDYPWLLLIDGLDEVPASSNRNQVMRSIQDFFLEVATLGGDVAAVATTRPQGYSDEFSPSEYRHFHLNSLTVEEALVYAEGLVSIRAGEGTPTARKVLDRLHRASREEHTQKLFESPLQVTILEVLLEKLGKAPNDRSRLYSAYYNVISQREQEKSGALSDLLQRYESDVDYLHRRIGFELQKRGAAVGETSSSLTVEEFDQFILERFRTQGHLDGEVETLARDFSALVTDRLVFLAKLQADRIGFELRSLQEYMAGEYIVSFPENQVIGEVQKIATLPYWRNVVLFTIGSIFSGREHLRAEVVLLCDRLNDEPRHASVLLPGADLALDILRDGSCLSMPLYSRGLMKNALRMIEAPHGPNVQALVPLASTDFSELLWQAIESLDSATASHWINRAALLSALRVDDGDRGDVGLRRLFDSANEVLKRHLIEWAWDTTDHALGSIIDSHFALAAPSIFFSGRRMGRRPHPRRHDRPQPEWMKHLHIVNGYAASDRARGEAMQSDRFSLLAVSKHLGLDEESWRWMSNLPTEDEEWAPFKSLAAFAVDPSKSRLADVLEMVADCPSSDVMTSIAPWPVVACMRHANHISQTTTTVSRSDALRQVATMARTGSLGDAEAWVAAQERWGHAFPVTPTVVASSVSQNPSLPIGPSIGLEGFVPKAYSYHAHNLVGDSDEPAVRELILAMVRYASSDSAWMEIAAFLGSIFAREANGEVEQVFDALADGMLKNGHSVTWVGWLNLVPMSDERPDAGVLQILGLQPRLFGVLGDELPTTLFDRAQRGTGDLAPARLALASRPELLESMTECTLERLARGADSELLGALIPISRLMKADDADIWMGSHDAEFTQISSESNTQFDAAWFAKLLAQRDTEHSECVAARGASVVADIHPAVAENWLKTAKSLFKPGVVAANFGQPSSN